MGEPTMPQEYKRTDSWPIVTESAFCERKVHIARDDLVRPAFRPVAIETPNVTRDSQRSIADQRSNYGSVSPFQDNTRLSATVRFVGWRRIAPAQQIRGSETGCLAKPCHYTPV